MADEANELRAELVRDAMVAFAQDVMAIQLAGLNRESTGYNAIAFDIACDGFLVGALLTISEKFPLPTPAREAAFLGLIAYLTKIKGLRLDQARERVFWHYNVPEGSKSALLFEIGYKHWKNPNALKKYFEIERPGNEESQEWTDRIDRRKRYILLSAGVVLLGVLLLVAVGRML